MRFGRQLSSRFHADSSAHHDQEETNRCSSESKLAAITEARLMEMVFPEQTNHYGTLFGGQALALMDKAAFMVASRYRAPAGRHPEHREDRLPRAGRQGQLVELVVADCRAPGGRRSPSTSISMREDLLTGDRQLGTRGRFVLVALDAQGKPTASARPRLPSTHPLPTGAGIAMALHGDLPRLPAHRRRSRAEEGPGGFLGGKIPASALEAVGEELRRAHWSSMKVGRDRTRSRATTSRFTITCSTQPSWSAPCPAATRRSGSR